MRYSIEKIGIHVLAFFVARCHMFGLYPFVVPFFMAAYLQERSSISLYVVLMTGLLSVMQLEAFLKYSLVICFLLVLFKKTDRRKMFSDNHQIALASGMILWAFSMPYQYLITRQDGSLLYSLLEGVIAGCTVLVFEQAFVAFRVGPKRMFANNERFIGLFAIMTAALFGCPLIEQPVHLLYSLSAGLLLYNSFRFDGSVGVTTGSIVGLVMAFRMENVNYLAVMIILAGMMVLLKELGKVGVLLAFLAGDVLLGYVYERSLLEPVMLLSAMLAAVLFWLMPHKWLKQVSQIKEGNTGLSQDILIQEATRNRIYDFGQAFLAMEKMLEHHESEREKQLPNGLSNIYLSGDGISLLNVVESQSNRLLEMRKNFIRQFGQIGDVITTFPEELTDKTMYAEFFEGRLTESFGRMGVGVKKAVMVKDGRGRVRVYAGCYLIREQVITGEMLAKRVSKILGKTMVCVNRGSEAVTRQECRYCFVEQGKYMLTTGVTRKSRNGETICGDNFSVSKVDTQKAFLMLSDGMGSGESASIKSEQVVELLEQLLSAGFRRELAIELMNSLVSFLADGDVTTSLDLAVVDFYTGTADFIKLGASTTFIKRKNKVECIRSTTLPVGVLEEVEFDTCERTLYHGDMIIMVSDGVVDGILFEDKEAYLAEVIANQSTNNVQVMAENIMEEVERMQRGSMRDDTTILIAGVWEN